MSPRRWGPSPSAGAPSASAPSAGTPAGVTTYPAAGAGGGTAAASSSFSFSFSTTGSRSVTTSSSRSFSHGPRPAVLVLPGGGYSHYGEHEAGPVAQWLADLGLHAFTLHYPVGTRHPGPLDAARAALAWIHDGDHGLAVDRTRVAVIGFSAGGHLAAHLVTTLAAERSPLLPARLVLGYPVVSFDDDGHRGSAVNLLGADASEQVLHEHSPVAHLSANHPPTFLWHTADDAAVPLAGSLRYAAGLTAVGVPVDLHVFAHGVHGIGLARPGVDPSPERSSVTEAMDAVEWPGLCERWLRRADWL